MHLNMEISFFSITYDVQEAHVSLVSTGTCSPAVRMAQTHMSACICSLTNLGDTERGHMSRRGQSTLPSMTSKIMAFVYITHFYERKISFLYYQHE